MIDFSNNMLFKLTAIHPSDVQASVQGLLVGGEEIVSAYKAVRDMVIFTNKRVICINVQGITGAKKDFTSLPYSKVTAFSVETAGTFDFDSELDLWLNGIGKVRLEFKAKCNITELAQLIGSYVL